MNEIRLNELLNKIYYEYLDSHEAEEFIIYFKRLKQDKDNLQSKIDKANEILEEILVVNDWEHEGRFRPVKNTTAQDVYKAVCMLYGILETPYRSDYGALKEDK